VFFLVEAGWQSLLGFGIVQFRLASVASGLLLLITAHFIVKRLTGERPLALLVLSLLALDYTFLQHAGIGRCEMLSLTFAVGAVAAYLKLREGSRSLAIVSSHTLMAASALTHPVGTMLWVPALLGLQIYLDPKDYRLRTLTLITLPYLVGGGAWGLYILQDPAAFRSQFQHISLGMGRLSGFAHPLLAVKREITERFLAYYGVRPHATPLVMLKMILPLGYLLGLAGALVIPSARRYPFLRLALALFSAQFLILAILEGTKQFQYIVHVIPTLTMVLGTVIWLVWSRRLIPRALPLALFAILLILQLGPTLFRVVENPYHNHFLPVLNYIRPDVERGTLLISQAEFSVPFGFPDNVITDPTYGWKRPERPLLVVVDEAVMARNTAGAKETRPGLYRYLNQEFRAEYEPAFTSGQYTVYKRR